MFTVNDPRGSLGIEQPQTAEGSTHDMATPKRLVTPPSKDMLSKEATIPASPVSRISISSRMGRKVVDNKVSPSAFKETVVEQIVEH